MFEMYMFLGILVFFALSIVLTNGKAEDDYNYKPKRLVINNHDKSNPIRESRKAYLERLSAQVRGEWDPVEDPDNIYYKAVRESWATIKEHDGSSELIKDVPEPKPAPIPISHEYRSPSKPIETKPEPESRPQSNSKSTTPSQFKITTNNIASILATRANNILQATQTMLNPEVELQTSISKLLASRNTRTASMPNETTQYVRYQLGLDVSPVHGVRNLGRSPTLEVPVVLDDDYPPNPEETYKAFLEQAHAVAETESRKLRYIRDYRENIRAYDEVQKRLAVV